MYVNKASSHESASYDGTLLSRIRTKMALMSLHSWKLVKFASNQKRVILCAYVSERVCTMYLFYQNPEDEEESVRRVSKVQPVHRADARALQFVMHQIVQYDWPFNRTHSSMAVGFLRRLYNFADNIDPVPVDTYRRLDLKTVLVGLQSISKKPSTTTKPTGSRETGASTSQSKKRKLNAPSGQDARDAPDVEALECLKTALGPMERTAVSF